MIVALDLLEERALDENRDIVQFSFSFAEEFFRLKFILF